jgi:Zn-finger protein
MNQESQLMICATCGCIPKDEPAARLTWAFGVENGQRVWTCDDCSRKHLRSVEGKLDSTWW